MAKILRGFWFGMFAVLLTACSGSLSEPGAIVGTPSAQRARIDRLIDYYSGVYHVPAGLVRKVVARESTFNPSARNGPYIGLMQIHPTTARTMGYRGGPNGLFDPDTNLRYGVKYLAGAYLVAHGDWALADRYYQTGYYYVAKRMGLLEKTGLR